MNKDALSKKEGKFIIFNNEGGLEYPDIDESTLKYVEYNKEKVKKELIDKNIVIIRDYLVKVEELDLDFKNYFFAHFYNMVLYNPNDLISLSYKDKRTGLYNRNLWIKICENTICPINSSNYSIILITLDSNDEDENIKNISKSIKKNISHLDIAIRNRNEFIIILPNKDKNKSIEVLHKIQNDIDLNIKYGIEHTKDKEKFKDTYESVRKFINEKSNINKYKDLEFIKEYLLNIFEIIEKNIKDNNIKENIKNKIIEIENVMHKHI